MNELILGREESYDPQREPVWAFRRVNDEIVHGIDLCLSNMCGKYPFQALGHTWPNSEVLYLCGEFSEADNENQLNAQKALASSRNGYAAKRFVKAKYKKFVRPDFLEFRLQWMLWVVWQKCLGNEDFRNLLRSVPDNVILVEDTTSDTGGTAEIWGCRNKPLRKAREEQQARLLPTVEELPKKKKELTLSIEWNKLDNIGIWTGQNNIGKILMICRKCIMTGREPEIDIELLRRHRIHIFSHEINF